MTDSNLASPTLKSNQNDPHERLIQTGLKSLTAVFNQTGQPLNLTKINIPDLKPGEIWIKTEYTTLCRSDLNTYAGKRLEKNPTILGHENIGHIAAFSPDAENMDIRGRYLTAGDRVSWAVYATDPTDLNYIHVIPQKIDKHRSLI